ncbi:MAG: thrombospondin type 3 repeat-containing protein, partial [Candidatus Poseidoniaceae archaeon]|nr:thrombospondin type 3 repeat-containing protein [Candidatus Poseidoniaceae archaeon]
GWKSTPTTDEDSDGCEDISQDSDGDGTIDKFDQCPNTAANNTVDDRGCSTIQIQDTITESNDATDDLSFNEKLMTGDLDAIGLILAIFVPIIGVGLTIMVQKRKRAHLKRLQKLIRSVESESQLRELQSLLRKSVAEEKLTQVQYSILVEEVEMMQSTFSDESEAAHSSETKEKGNQARSKSKSLWQKAVADELKDDSYRVDEEGIEWWEDEKKQWWYRRPEEESWEKWED